MSAEAVRTTVRKLLLHAQSVDGAFATAFVEFFYGNFTEALVLRIKPTPVARSQAGPSPIKFDVREAEDRAKEAVEALDDFGRGQCALAIQAGGTLGESVCLDASRALLAKHRRSWLR